MTKKEILNQIQNLLVKHNYLEADYSTKKDNTEEALLASVLDVLQKHYLLLDKSRQLIEHTVKVYLSQSTRGAYPIELLSGTSHFLGIPGFTAHQQILQQLELLTPKEKE